MADADPFAASPDVSAKESPTLAPERSRAARWRVPLMLLAPALVLIGAAVWWFTRGDTVSTDNAYVKQDIVSVAGEVSGKVVSVAVKENQTVEAGEVLFTIDPAPYRVAIAEADAQIAEAQAQITAMSAEVGATAADGAGARNDLALAQANYNREKALMDRGFNTRARMDAATHAVAAARDRIAVIQADVARDRAKLAKGAQVPGVNPMVAAGRARREKAELELGRTVVRAPSSGRVSQAGRLQVGQSVAPGIPLLSIVRTGSTRIEANFKETDLGRIRIGQPVDVVVDAYPGVHFRGRVESIGAGTGSEFSVLPAQNATGNWVKVIQRVPVRIAILGQPQRPLLAGLSAVARVDVGGTE